ncbi:hypothetical protein AB0G79_30465 [Streptomyces sp. NPDC020807]|uniref:hypothetical protein n=1 Tax=Streptomyces sp. NPDC020807 TaxID=3155119 RepID=UPI0033C3D1E8
MADGTAAAGSHGGDTAHGRLGWTFGLVADDPSVRAAALARLRAARRDARTAQLRANELWHLTLPLGHEEQYREPAFRQAREENEAARGRLLPDALWVADSERGPLLPYELLFIEWEARFPAEWTEHAKAWGTKEAIVRRMAALDHDPSTRARLVDIVDLVVRRAYRCKDRAYVGVARAVDGPDLRGRLDAAAASDEPWARRHAGYVLRMLDRPELPNTRRVWRAWVAGQPV